MGADMALGECLGSPTFCCRVRTRDVSGSKSHRHNGSGLDRTSATTTGLPAEESSGRYRPFCHSVIEIQPDFH